MLKNRWSKQDCEAARVIRDELLECGQVKFANKVRKRRKKEFYRIRTQQMKSRTIKGSLIWI